MSRSAITTTCTGYTTYCLRVDVQFADKLALHLPFYVELALQFDQYELVRPEFCDLWGQRAAICVVQRKTYWNDHPFATGDGRARRVVLKVLWDVEGRV